MGFSNLLLTVQVRFLGSSYVYDSESFFISLST